MLWLPNGGRLSEYFTVLSCFCRRILHESKSNDFKSVIRTIDPAK